MKDSLTDILLVVICTLGNNLCLYVFDLFFNSIIGFIFFKNLFSDVSLIVQYPFMYTFAQSKTTLQAPTMSSMVAG